MKGLQNIHAAQPHQSRELQPTNQGCRYVFPSDRHMDDRHPSRPNFVDQRVLTKIEDNNSHIESIPFQSPNELREMFFRTPGAMEVIDEIEHADFRLNHVSPGISKCARNIVRQVGFPHVHAYFAGPAKRLSNSTGLI